MAFERIVLNIIPDGELPVFHCSQYENGRPVIIDLVSSDDDAFLVGEDVSVELHCRKVDDNIVTLEPDEVTNNTVTFVSTEQLTACPGDNLCEIVLYSDTDPVQTIATLNFILHVEPDPLEGGLTSETQIHNLTEQIEEITQQVIGDDYYNKTEVDDLLSDKADQATTYTKSEVDTALNLKADKATTYTKTQVDSALALKADKSDTYTKTQVDNALALKANTADLATVATTGDYDDLIDKPTIPTKTSDLTNDSGYITETAIDNILPIVSISGEIVTFNVALEKKLKSVTVDNAATTVTRCGVNLWDEEWEAGGINGTTGEDFVLNTAIRSKGYTHVKGNVSLYYYCGVSGLQFRICYYDANKDFISSLSVTNINQAYTTPVNCAFVRFAMRDTYGTTYNNDISINYPATDTTYHAYNGEIYPVPDIDDITSLNGVNNIFADVGDVSVQAYDSIQHYIDQRT